MRIKAAWKLYAHLSILTRKECSNLFKLGFKNLASDKRCCHGLALPKSEVLAKPSRWNQLLNI
eukprot:490177-Amphidinium_carterae.1